jgi:membrane protease YdiL (CAAX protease family)
MAQVTNSRWLLPFGFALLMLNDFAFMALSRRPELLYADYGFKLVLLVAILLAARRLPPPVVSWRKGNERLAAGLLGALVLLVVQVDPLSEWIDKLLPSWELFAWPKNIGPWMKAIDLSLGLALTAFVEEFLFRRLALSVLSGSMAVRVVTASLLFGLIHWGGGLGSMIAVFLAGLAFSLVYLRTGSLALVILAHYLVDLILFF